MYVHTCISIPKRISLAYYIKVSWLVSSQIQKVEVKTVINHGKFYSIM